MAEEIMLGKAEDESDVAIFPDGSGCQLCLENAAKYTCPRCNVKYCSLECYKCEKHMKCSEMFYKNCVLEALQDDTVDRKEREKMVEILKRHHEEKDEDLVAGDEEGEDLEERLQGLNLDQDGEKIWSKLTEEEKREFAKAVDTGYIGSLLEPWVPWWINVEQRPSADETLETTKNANTSRIPKILKNIPEFDTLLKSRQPSSDTKYNLLNILYSYVYICKFYNGSHLDFLNEAVGGLWKLSAVLHQNINFISVDSALRSSIESSQQHKEYHNSVEFSLSVIHDVALLLKGETCSSESTHHVELALSDMHRLFAKSASFYKSQKTRREIKDNDSTNIVKSLWLAKKKVFFMLAWFRENQELCSSLEPFLPVVAEAINMEFKQHEDEKRKIEQSRICGPLKNKKLVEEIL